MQKKAAFLGLQRPETMQTHFVAYTQLQIVIRLTINPTC